MGLTSVISVTMLFDGDQKDVYVGKEERVMANRRICKNIPPADVAK
ncbi:unnamed protein product, partial [marine sediment metagenome]